MTEREQEQAARNFIRLTEYHLRRFKHDNKIAAQMGAA